MSKVYTVNNEESTSNQIPSVEYIDEVIKMTENVLMGINKEFTGFPSIKSDEEELPVGVKEQAIISANEIKTDSEHKFISDGILATIADKPSKFEVELYLEEAKQKMMDAINETYMKIINTPNVVNKLRDISTILNEDTVADGLLNTLSYKFNIEDYQEHVKSSIHMNNNDRKALNILLKCLSAGFADWNAEDDAYNMIKNKPESLPANGGNADTVSNHDIKDLINKDDYDIVVGSSKEKYSKDACDIYAEDGYTQAEVLASYVKSLKNTGNVLFKRGDYKIEYIDSYDKSVIFEGTDRRLSCIKANMFINIYNSVFKHISFLDTIIYIGSYCEITDISFTNCVIVLNRSINCNITNCIFDNCEIRVEGSIMNNIVKFNRYIQTKPLQYIGGNNIISENI